MWTTPFGVVQAKRHVHSVREGQGLWFGSARERRRPAWLSRADRDGSLAAFLKPDLTPPERTLAQVEGWILGVPGLIRTDKGCDDLATRR
jgi:hypothetical protein